MLEHCPETFSQSADRQADMISSLPAIDHRELLAGWNAAAFWYEATPSEPLPPMPGVKARTADIPKPQK